MISSDGWVSWAERVVGDQRKQNGGRNPVAGIVGHSAEGGEAYLRGYNVFHDHYATRRASWTFSNLQSGHLLQHFSVFAQTWASGASYPNNSFVPIEHEGRAPTPLTRAQVDTTSRLLGELSAFGGWAPVRLETVWEHNECRRWGADPTACPSNRIPWDDVLEGLEPAEPVQTRRRDMAIISLPNGSAYLVYGEGRVQWIPDTALYVELQGMVFGNATAAVSQRTWDWLHAIGWVRMKDVYPA